MKSHARWLMAGLQAMALSTFVPAVLAGPGAHGPNGEHLDGPAQAIAGSGNVPRFEARTEIFEMVGRIQGGEFSIFINRFETNEPVLQATVEIETGNVKAKARFHADLGDYSVEDKAFLDVVSRPGEHALVVMVVAGEVSDLLDGTLTVAPDASRTGADHAHVWWEDRRVAYGTAALAAAVLLGIAAMRRKRPASGSPGVTR